MGTVKLSKREYQILCLMKEGLLNKQIAKRLGISEKTVSTYISRMRLKMGINQVNAYYMVAHAIKHDWFSPRRRRVI